MIFFFFSYVAIIGDLFSMRAREDTTGLALCKGTSQQRGCEI